MKQIILLCIFVVLLAIQLQCTFGQKVKPEVGEKSGGEFWCYQCDNYHDPKDCGHGKDVAERHKHPCGKYDTNVSMYLPPGKEWKFCRKIVTLVDFDVNANKATERIKRTCGYEDSEYNDKCYYRAGLGGRVSVCTCMDPECNHGSLTTSSSLGFYLSTTLFLVLVKLINFS